MNQPLLEARDVWFNYPGGPDVLTGASLSLARGEIGALIGANGCGKSTLIRILAGVLDAGRGQTAFDGSPVSKQDRRLLAQRLAYVPQLAPLEFPFTAMEVVLTGRSPYNSRFQWDSQRDRSKALEAMAMAGAEHLAERPVTALSGGERQMVLLAKALAQEPECLLLDEPAASLDLKHRAALVSVLIRLRETQGVAALLVTHDLELLEPVADRIFAMACGRVVESGPPADVMTEAALRRVYGDPGIRTGRVAGRTFVWSEPA